jgi:hypothetical protein
LFLCISSCWLSFMAWRQLDRTKHCGSCFP